MGNSSVVSNISNTSAFDIKMKSKLQKIYDNLQTNFIKTDWKNGRVVVIISGMQKIKNLEISRDWFIHSEKKEVERELLDAINNALSVSYEYVTKQLAEFKNR